MATDPFGSEVQKPVLNFASSVFIFFSQKYFSHLEHDICQFQTAIKFSD